MHAILSRKTRMTSALFGGLVIASACVAQARQGAAEKTGQALDNAGRGIKGGVQRAFARTRANVHDQEVISRIYSRIHWDKALVNSTLELEVRDGGTAVLRGGVPDEAARARAVDLAKETVGVTLVVDELTVLPPPRIVPAPPGPGAATGVRTTITP